MIRGLEIQVLVDFLESMCSLSQLPEVSHLTSVNSEVQLTVGYFGHIKKPYEVDKAQMLQHVLEIQLNSKSPVPAPILEGNICF